jgi:hypothetical protein
MASHNLLEKIKINNFKNTCIVEIGSARESAGDQTSTSYFKNIATKIDATFFSVDFSPLSHAYAREIINENAILSDGATFLSSFEKYSNKKISILYLDNFDIIYNDKHKESLLKRVGNIYSKNNEDLNNERSSIVHLEQLISALPYLENNNVIIIDDTMIINDIWWGKGALAVPHLLSIGYTINYKSDDGVLLTNYL